MSGAPVVVVEDVAQSFGARTIYRHVSFTVRPGEVFVILGGSGCGKSTLLRQVIGLLPPSEGRVHVLGHDMYGARGDVLRRIGVMFQSGALFGSMTLLENVMLPLQMHTTLPPAARAAIARAKLGLVGLADATGLYPAEISGGRSTTNTRSKTRAARLLLRVRPRRAAGQREPADRTWRIFCSAFPTPARWPMGTPTNTSGSRCTTRT